MDLPNYNIAEVDLNFVEDPQELLNVGRQMYEKANPGQEEFVDKIIALVNEQSGQCAFFLQEPAGCGKTFVYLTLYYLLRGDNKIAVYSASTGIIATLLSSGHFA